MKKLLFFLFALLLAGGIGYGAIAYTRRQKESLIGMRPDFDGLQILESTPAGIVVRVYLKIANSSDIDITILNQSYDILINGVKVNSVQKPEPVVIANKGETTTSFTVTINPKQQLKDIFLALVQTQEVLPGISNLTVTVKGSLELDTALLAVSPFKFTLSKKVKDLLTNSGFSNYLSPASGFKVPAIPAQLYGYPSLVTLETVRG